MKAVTLVLLLAICTIESRKIVQINKNANIDFINMEGGGGARPNPTLPVQGAPVPVKPQNPEPPKTPTAPSPQPKAPVPAVTTAKPLPVVVTTTPHSAPIKPTQLKPVPNQMDLEWKPLPAKPNTASGVSTPAYGSVQQLVTFYDSKGKASVIRPHSYSQAVKQG